MRTLRGAGLALSALILCAAIAGVSYQLIQAHADALQFPPQGRLVDIGGYKLNLICSGQGSPAVMLEASPEEPAISWAKVQSGIAQFTRVCSYDRAGYAWSDPATRPRTGREITAELHRLLQSARETPPPQKPLRSAKASPLPSLFTAPRWYRGVSERVSFATPVFLAAPRVL